MCVGIDRKVLPGDILRGSIAKDNRAGLRTAQRLVFAQRVEHDGLHGRGDRLHHHIHLVGRHELRLAHTASGSCTPASQARLRHTKSSSGP